MSIPDDGFCEIFVEGQASELDLEELIRQQGLIRNGEFLRFEGARYDLDLLENEYRAQGEFAWTIENIVLFRFRLEIEPRTSVSRKDYVSAVARLFCGLRAAGWAAFAACEFEERLESSWKAWQLGKWEPKRWRAACRYFCWRF